MNDVDVLHHRRRPRRRPSSLIAAPLFFASATSSSLDDGNLVYEGSSNPLSALLRRLRGGDGERRPSKLQVAISSVLFSNSSSATSTSTSSTLSPNSSSSSNSSTTAATTFRPSAKFLSSRLGRAWLEQLESQRALLTGAAGAAARAAGAADAAGRARVAFSDAKASLGAQLAWDRAKAEWLASQLLEAGENGILNPANIVLDAYVAGKARYYLRRHALRTAAVLATACLLIDGLKSAAAAAARRGGAAAAGMGFLPRLREEVDAAAEAEKEEKEKAEKEKEEDPAHPRRGRTRRLLRFATSGAVALGRKAVEAALPTPLLAAWLVAELML